ncbi:CAP domain-containing protein [Roseovarius pelagicus]|uniref:CAP domain-containing protein n=1 Tax=Roseovarius pelagicus TaxID=2980108 RepID=A0ABY6DB14_9RHOB|nr:CAP domain-containing protein [Roseovarius pelagicus]UXX83288.1 CAP domain-containing protein [Roseovarius pelagicus]
MQYALIFLLGLMCLPASAQQVENLGPAALQQMNTIRATNGLGSVQVDKKLTEAATAHARDMAKKGFFSHTGSNGSSIGDRARKARYGFCFIAENIAKGHGSLTQVLTGWLNSPGHRANMLHVQVTEFGLVRGPGNHWVMVLGRPGC